MEKGYGLPGDAWMDSLEELRELAAFAKDWYIKQLEIADPVYDYKKCLFRPPVARFFEAERMLLAKTKEVWRL